MKLIILFFPSADKLIRFRLAINPKVVEENLHARTLFCCCNEDQMELAEYVYGASIFEMQGSLN
ncbi:MAG: hypothetical protein J7502_00145 [Flavisolibacter sp.]|nr:hypothetical protein [Flavisolibacter sp.]